MYRESPVLAAGEEAALVRRATGGDSQAFADIYSGNLTRVYRYIYYLVANKSDAEDLTSQTFLNAWANIGRYTDRGIPILAWLLRIGRNLAMKHLGRRRPHGQLNGGEVDEASEHDPEAVAEEATEQVALREAIAQLPPTQQQVIFLRFAEGMPNPEVAQKIGKTEGAVRVIQYRALRNLAHILGEFQEDDRHAASGLLRERAARSTRRAAEKASG